MTTSLFNPPANFGGIELFYLLLSNYNYATLAFSIFYSTILYIDFYFFRVFLMYKKDYKMHLEARGVNSIQSAWWIWLRYLVCLSFFNLVFIAPNSLVRSVFVCAYLYLLLGWKLPSDIISVCYSIPKSKWVGKFSLEIKQFINIRNLTKIKINSFTIIYVLLYLIFLAISIIFFTTWSLII